MRKPSVECAGRTERRVIPTLKFRNKTFNAFLSVFKYSECQTCGKSFKLGFVFHADFHRMGFCVG